MAKKRRKSKVSRALILKYLQDYRYNSILVKNLLAILVVLIVSFAIIMALVINKMNKSIENELGIMSINALSKTQERVDAVMREVVQISGQISLDNDVQLMLLPDTGQLLTRNPMQAVKSKIETYSGIVDYIDSIYVYSSKNNIIVTNEGGWKIDDFSDVTWYDNLTERVYEPARMVMRLKNDNFPYLISYLQPLRLTQMEFLGGIIVNIDIGKLDELVVSNVENSNENLMIVDERDNIIFSSNQEYLLMKLDRLNYYDAISSQGDSGYQIIKEGNEELILTVTNSDYYNWKYISTVPVSAYREYQQGFSNFFVFLVGLIVIISVAAGLFISFYSYTPVMNILNLLKNPDMYEGGLDIGGSFHKDEAQEISLNIIRNIYSNRQMQKEMKYYLNTVDEAYLTALQAQISPHFLYNTLENIRWRAFELTNGDNEVTQIILKLSEMLRTSLDNEQQIITIREEIRHAQLYTDILSLRYGDKVTVNWDVDEAALDLPIVKISLQPLIENAVYHGIKPLRGAGIIQITVQRLATSVMIKVVDNGVGMSDEELLRVNLDLSEKYVLKEDHIGLRNVHQRLKLLTSDKATMRIQSKRNVGTTVIIEIPFTPEKDD